MANREQYEIQRYWFSETTETEVLKRYGLKPGTHKWEKARAILAKSRKQFIQGLSHFTRNDIDRKIMAVCV